MTVYFGSIVLTCLLTGALTWIGWRQRSMPTGRTFAWLMLGNFLLALFETLYMLAPDQAWAGFWFNLRFIFIAVIPVIFLLFTLEYYRKIDWVSKPLLVTSLIIPILTQIMLWTNRFHGLWVKQDVGFHREGLIWIADTSQRLAGVWFLVHNFYTSLLLLVGITVLLVAAWRQPRAFLKQSLLVSFGTLVSLVTGLLPVFNPGPPLRFNPFVPGIGASALLYALAVLRFDFIRHTPADDEGGSLTGVEPKEKRSLAFLLVVVMLLGAVVMAAGFTSYANFKDAYLEQVESELTTIADLKVYQLASWRSERLSDAESLMDNTAFSALLESYIKDLSDQGEQDQLQSWLDSLRLAYQYSSIYLFDSEGAELLSSPASAIYPDHPVVEISQASSGDQSISFDFHHHTDGDIHYSILAPIHSDQDGHPLGAVILEVDPDIYLYPYMATWPVESETAETLIVSRDGDDVLFLNPLRFDQQAALNLRIPLTETDVPAVKAVLGETGLVEGIDYRSKPVLAVIAPVPDSPWFIVVRVDQAEIYAPLHQRLWQIVVFYSVLVLIIAVAMGTIWREQRLRYYRVQVQAAEKLRSSEERFRVATKHSSLIFAQTDLDLRYTWIRNPHPDFDHVGILGKRDDQLDINEGTKQLMRLKQQVIDSGRGVRMDIDFPVSDGLRTFDVIAEPIHDISGQLIGVTTCSLDITDRKQAEVALEKNQEKIQRLLDQQIAIIQLTLALGESLDLKETYSIIYKHTRTLADAWVFIISSYNEETRMIRADYVVSDGEVLDVSEFPPIALGEPGQGTQSKVIHSGEPLYAPDYRAAIASSKTRYVIEKDGSIEEETPEEKDKEMTTRSALYVPMKREGKTVGVMQLQSPRLDAYSPEDIDLLTSMANVVAIAIQNARLYSNVQRELAERKQAEEALSENEKLLRSIAENYPNSYLSIIEQDLTVGFSSGQEFKRQNLKPEEFLGLSLEAIFGEHTSLVEEKYLETFDGHETTFELFINGQNQLYKTVPLYNQQGKIERILSVVENITERKQAEEALVKQKNVADNYLNIAGSIILALNLDGEIALLNKKGYEVLGYEEGQLKGKNWFSTCVTDEIASELKVYFEELKTGKTEDQKIHENEVVRKDGQKRMIRWFNTLVTDELGNITGLLSSGEDVTADREKDRQLKTSAAELKKAQQVAHLGSWTWYITDNSLEWSDEMYQIFGIEEDEFTGDLADVLQKAIHPDDRVEVEKSNLSVMQGGKPIPMEYRVVMPDGRDKTVWAEAGELVLDREGKPSILRGIVQDISERKKIENKLRDSNTRFSTIFHSSPIPIALTRFSDNHLEDVNQAWLDLTGYQRDEVVGRQATELNLYADPAQRQQMISMIQLQNRVEGLEVTLRKKSGEEGYLLLSAEKIELGGEPYLLSLAQDITEIKHLHDQLQASRSQLESLAQKLITSQEDERKHISRELHDDAGQSLMAAIISLDLLRSELPEVSESAQEKFTQVSALIETTLDTLRHLAQGLRPPMLDEIGLNSGLHDLCIGYGERSGFSVDYQGTEVEALSKISQITLYRFAQEALNNVTKHAEARTVSVELKIDGNRVQLIIRDDGKGFDPAEVMKVKNIFSGIGLKNMRERLKLVEGEFWVESSPGEGTTVTGSVPYPSKT